ncbi:MAG: dihydrolipoamide acetyltransferase family protein [Verrucomicrobiota bacterium]
MAHPVAMPKPGQYTEECTIINWHKHEGETVSKGDVLFEIETDKASMEVESFFDGKLLKVYAGDGETIPVQTVVGYIGEEGEEVPETPPQPAVEKKGKEKTGKPAAEATTATGGAETASAKPAPEEEAETDRTPQKSASQTPAETAIRSRRLKISPRARAFAKRCAVDPSSVNGSGPGGRIVEKDVKQFLEAQGYFDLRITPAAKLMARENEIDLLKVRGSGTDGRITVDDVKRAVAEKPQPMSTMRRVIAARLTESFNTAPHFFVSVEVDMTDLLSFREKKKEQGQKFSVTDFIMEAVILSLKDEPLMNSSTDGENVIWNSSVNLGLAVSLPQGLVVPVIHDADTLSLAELREKAIELSKRARDGKLLPDEMTGGTFTISNMGMMDVENFTAIINPGEAGILAVSSTRKKPVVVKDEITVRSIMKITLSSDHRIIDGVKAAEFANSVKIKLEDMDLWKTLMS